MSLMRFDEVGAFVDAGFGYVFPECVDGNQGFGEGLSDGFQNGDDALHFLTFCGDGVVRSRGAATNVDEVGTVGNHLLAVLQGLVHLVESATVGKRVGCHVQDAHEGRTVENEGFIMNTNLKHHSFLAKLHFFCEQNVFSMMIVSCFSSRTFRDGLSVMEIKHFVYDRFLAIWLQRLP